MREKLCREIKDEIKELELREKEEYWDELFQKLESILKLSQKKNEQALCRISNYEMFLIALGCTNSDTASWEDILADAEEVKNIVNGWDSSNALDYLDDIQMYEYSKGMQRYINNIEALGLNPNFLEYRLRSAAKIMAVFVSFKDAMKDLSSKEGPVSKSTLPPLAVNHPLASRITKIDHVKRTADKKYILSEMSGVILTFEKYFNEEKENHTKRLAQNLKRIKAYENILRMIETNQIYEINIPTEWNEMLNPNILCELYLYINDRITIDYLTEEKMNKNLNEIINQTPLSRFFYERHIDPNTIDRELLEKLEKKNIDETKAILDFLLEIGFNINDLLTKHFDLLSNIDIKNINFLNFLIDSNILSKTTIINNPCILTSEFLKIQINYEILKAIVDFDNVYYSDEILLEETKLMKDKLSVLKEYNLTKNNYMYLICNYHMLKIYDLMIEHEIPLNLFISICRTSNPLNTIKRILIYKSLDIPYEVNKYSLKKDVIEESKFICLDEELDMYIGSVVPYIVQNEIEGTTISSIINEELVKQLDSSYLYTKDSYIFGTTIISRPKLLRNLEASINSKDIDLLRAIISSSILSEKNIYEIQSSLQQKKLLK